MAIRDHKEANNGRHTPDSLRPSASSVRQRWAHKASRSHQSSVPSDAPPAGESGQPGVRDNETSAILRWEGQNEFGSRTPSDTLAPEQKQEISVTSRTLQEEKGDTNLIIPQETALPTKQGSANRTDPVVSAGPAGDRSSLETRETEVRGQTKLKLEGDGSSTEPKPCLVCVRVRPELLHEISAGGQLCVDTPHDTAGVVTVSGYKDREYTFHFDYVFDQDATQEAIYRSTCDCLLEKLLSGYSASVMAYGQTGAGKTYTMLGEVADHDFHRALTNPATQGVVPRMLQALFQRILKENKDSDDGESGVDQQSQEEGFEQAESGKPLVTFSVRASLVEVYNDTVRDLLAPHRDNLSIRDPIYSGSNRLNSSAVLTEATEVPVATAQEAFTLIYTGFARRAQGTTLLNEQSSRSHAIFQLIIRRNSMAECRVTCSRLCLVDLAGSERVSKADARGVRLREAQSINKSLLALGNVISAVPQTQKGQKLHVPYRDSKLTRLLQHSFGGHTFTVLLLCCSPHTFNVKETLSTLRFGDRATTLKNQPVSVEAVDPELMLQRLQEAQTELRITHAQIRAYLAQTARQADAIKMLHAHVPQEVTLNDDEKDLLKLALQEVPILMQHPPRLQTDSPAPMKQASKGQVPSTGRPPRLPVGQRRGPSSPKALEIPQGQKKLPQERGRAERVGESASQRPKTAPFRPARPTTSISQRGSPASRRPVEQRRPPPTQRGNPEVGKAKSLASRGGDMGKPPLSVHTSKGIQEVTNTPDATVAQEETKQNTDVLKAAGEAEVTRRPTIEKTPSKGEEEKGSEDHGTEVERGPSTEGDRSQGTGAEKVRNTSRISREKASSRFSKFFSLSRGRSVNSKGGSRGGGAHSKQDAN